jgi:hypothetical protein
MKLDTWIKCRNKKTLFQMAGHQNVREISGIMQRSILSRFFRHHADTDDVIIVYLHLKLSISIFTCKLCRAKQKFKHHAQLTDHAWQRLSLVCGFLLLFLHKTHLGDISIHCKWNRLSYTVYIINYKAIFYEYNIWSLLL